MRRGEGPEGPCMVKCPCGKVGAGPGGGGSCMVRSHVGKGGEGPGGPCKMTSPCG